MTVGMTFGMAVRSLNRNKLRTALTALGIIIGVAAVIAMVAIGTGATSSIEQQIRGAGSNLIIVRTGSQNVGGVRTGSGATTTLTAEDAQAIRAEVPNVQYVAAGVTTQAQVVCGNQNWSTTIQGTDVDLLNIRSWPLESGSFFTDQDVKQASKVAVLGSVTRNMLFGEGADPVGETIRIRNQPFKVVGVLSSKGQSSMGGDQDDTVYVPYSTVQKKLLGITYVRDVTVSAASPGAMTEVMTGIEQLLRVRHGIEPGGTDDFSVRNMEEILSVLTASTTTMTYLLGSIAAVSLLVGGIGIMNIMLVSVTERTREIGLRLAIGAKSRVVLFQFLVEAVVLSLVGGLIGIGVGYGVAWSVRNMLGWPTSVSVDAVAMAFGFAALTGMFFGFYPARKAARLEPIEALRYE